MNNKSHYLKLSQLVVSMAIVGWFILWLIILNLLQHDIKLLSLYSQLPWLSSILLCLPLFVVSFVIAGGYSLRYVYENRQVLILSTLIGGVLVSILSYVAFLIIILVV